MESGYLYKVGRDFHRMWSLLNLLINVYGSFNIKPTMIRFNADETLLKNLLYKTYVQGAPTVSITFETIIHETQHAPFEFEHITN